MSDFKVLVRRITQPVINHPNADRLTVIAIDGYQAVANKLDDGTWRYNEGDYIVYIPEAAVLPEWALKAFGYWDAEKGKGVLAGSKGDRVKAIKLRSLVSQGLVIPVEQNGGELSLRLPVTVDGEVVGGSTHIVFEGEDVAHLLDIHKFDPPIPVAMAGEVANLHGKTKKYDFENFKSCPDIFEPGEPVVATEKLHGTFCGIAYHYGMKHPEMFYGGDVLVGSKGLSSQGLVFKDNAANDGNLYVKTLRDLLARGFGDDLHTMSGEEGDYYRPIHVFGEIFGRGVQDLTYGLSDTQFRVFDIAIDGVFLDHDTFVGVAKRLGLETVPVLYQGPFDAEVLKTHRDGKTMFGGANIREGIVVKSAKEARHPLHGRKIAKMVSDAYLLRKNKDGSEVSEFQ